MMNTPVSWIAENTDRIRYGGAAAMIGGLIGIVYSPFHTLAYLATADGADTLELWWIAAWAEPARSTFEPFLMFTAPHTVYLTYGRLYFLVPLGWACGLVALHVWQRHDSGRIERWGFRIAFTATIFLVLGGLGEYWVPGGLDISFLLFSLPGFLLTFIGLPTFALGTKRTGKLPKWHAWLLGLGAFPGILTVTVLTGHLSSGVVLVNIAWVIIGYTLWLNR